MKKLYGETSELEINMYNRCDICGKIAFMYTFISEAELVEKYKWKGMPINNLKNLLWFCCDHKMNEMLNFRTNYELWQYR